MRDDGAKMRTRGRWLWLTFFGVLLALGWWSVRGIVQQAPSVPRVDRSQVEEVEELSESLANALLELSVAVRDRDLEKAARFFADPLVATPLPSSLTTGGSSLHNVKWITSRTLDTPPPVELPGARWKGQLKSLLENFSSIEDARFKVTGALFGGPPEQRSGQGAIKFFLVGKDGNRKRLWMKGTGRIAARQTENPSWQVTRFELNAIQVLQADADLFSEVGEEAGVAIEQPSFYEMDTGRFVYHGAAAGDVNGDGLVDVVATGILQTYLYLNQGDGTFREVAAEAGLPPLPRATAPLLIDFDQDGDSDLFLAAVGDQALFENRLHPEGRLRFTDISLEAGVALPAIGFSATAGDVNGDGWPDIYVCSYNLYGQIMPNSWHKATNGTPNLLFINQGNRSFQEQAKQWGVDDGRWSYAAQFADVNGDHRLDLYVANDFGENALYVNLGDRFEDRSRVSGVVDPGNGMGVSFGDYDNDGVLDLYVTNMSSTAGKRILQRLFPEAAGGETVLTKLASGNTLFRGRGDGTFEDVTEQAGPFAAGWAWGGVFLDFDNDGWMDLFCTNGFVSGKTMKDT